MTSVVIRSVDRERVQKAVLDYAADLRRSFPEVKRVIWFGSWINGTPTPRSDVDLCIIVTTSDLAPGGRIAKYLPLGFPIALDLFVYTEEEFERLNTFAPGWYQAVATGREIY